MVESSFQEQWRQFQQQALALVTRFETLVEQGLSPREAAANLALPFQGQLAEAFVQNAYKLMGVKRIMGSPYATHPTRMAMIANLLLGGSVHAERSALFAMFHDYLEEGDGRHAEAVSLFRTEWSGDQTVVEAAIFLSEPVIDFTPYPHKKDWVEDVAYVLQITDRMALRPDEALVNASLIDKLDNAHDLVYITENRRYSPEKKMDRLVEKLGYFRFVLEHLGPWAHPRLFAALEESLHRQGIIHQVDQKAVAAMQHKLEGIRQAHGDELRRQIQQYHQTVLTRSHF